MSDMAEFRLKHGAEFPFDAPDEWSDKYPDMEAPAATSWAHRAARGVIADLNDRRGIKHGFSDIDEDVRAELVQSLTDIIQLAFEQDKKARSSVDE